ncbi:FAD-binding domain-containing protein [Mycena albidolilacea]|uniref:FAD-binding domain-containing protein n=1 Tax=Mycena albidolilacea TaxID=1033008 RepID=A0AAD7ACN8_9AGAR|nr:FAD-binding domain-containing protein [Mycena albidolilacea]
MKCFPTSPLLSLFIALAQSRSLEPRQNSNSTDCRNVPGSAGYPSPTAWNVFNATIFGQLLEVVPPAKYCDNLLAGGCTDAQWTSALFRGTIPGAMSYGYGLDPPSLCLRNGTTCGQGDLPVYSVEAETVGDVQAAVQFASKHNLRLVVKSTGHDGLGRSTAPNSLLIRVSKFQNVSSTDDFYVGGENMGSAVTIGSGVHANTIYQHNKGQGKFSVVAAAETVAPAGGQIQGGGHSPLSPAYGLVSDNALEFEIVVASGELLRASSASNTDLFFALRGGGAGSWGVIISATIRTFPTFNATSAITILQVPNNTVVGSLATLHAQHVFDWDSVQAGHFFWFEKTQIGSTDPNVPTSFMLFTYMPNTTAEQSQILLAPFINASLALPGVVFVSQTFKDGEINDVMFGPDDGVGGNVVLGSRLVPEALYRDSPEKVGPVYKELFDNGTTALLGQMVSGGTVSKNGHISSAVHPAWREAKTHLMFANSWDDSASLAQVDALRAMFQTTQLPLLEKLSGPNAGAYSNEADGSEPDFQSTFFGPNYAKLSDTKAKYDPHDLFIVAAGVGSDRWDEWGLCKV